MTRRKSLIKSPFKRRRAFRYERESFLVICEGKNTEPIYFRSFKLSSATIKTISYTNKGNAPNFVNAAITFKRNCFDGFDNYWIVFDKDKNTDNDFNRAITLAEQNGFKVAYSIQAFEFWFILHYTYHLGTMPRESYKARLDRNMGFPYDKTKETCRILYEKLKPHQNNAIRNAERVFASIGDHSNIASEESSTTVHLLVKELNKYL